MRVDGLLVRRRLTDAHSLREERTRSAPSWRFAKISLFFAQPGGTAGAVVDQHGVAQLQRVLVILPDFGRGAFQERELHDAPLGPQVRFDRFY